METLVSQGSEQSLVKSTEFEEMIIRLKKEITRKKAEKNRKRN